VGCDVAEAPKRKPPHPSNPQAASHVWDLDEGMQEKQGRNKEAIRV